MIFVHAVCLDESPQNDETCVCPPTLGYRLPESYRLQKEEFHAFKISPSALAVSRAKFLLALSLKA